MTTNIFLFLLLSIVSIILIFLIRFKRILDVYKNPENSRNILIDVCLLLGLALITFSFFAPYFFTSTVIGHSIVTTEATGLIGDTMGGIMNPFISIAGVIITGLAFYVQYKANEQQRELFLIEQTENKKQLQSQIDNQNDQIKIQKIESQFYEMLKLHRENISEMQIHGYDFEEIHLSLKKFEKVTTGRKVFVTMKTELEFIILLYVKDHVLDQEGFQKCYKIFFSGLDEFEKKHPSEKVFSQTLRLIRARHEHPIGIIKNIARKKHSKDLDLNINYKPFSGHASRLGHYFRHLYLTVKSVANSTVISDYEDKINYLRILRAQLSNHEQILLFYNWLSNYGSDCENDTQQFFTEYSMIHNLWWDSLVKDDFITNKVNFLRTKNTTLRKGKMFEID
ncbi:MAG: putative phage abortive infection protein [Bacteroidota bacterium]